MKKIPTLFARDENFRVIDKPMVDIAGATATVKWDGTCCLAKDGVLYKRHAVKPGKTAPDGFLLAEEQQTEKGIKLLGWVPVTAADKWHMEPEKPLSYGTYELIGPKVQGNPYGLDRHLFRRHGALELDTGDTDFRTLQDLLGTHDIEGIVWWRDGEPIAKLKRRDFGFAWPLEKEQEEKR